LLNSEAFDFQVHMTIPNDSESINDAYTKNKSRHNQKIVYTSTAKFYDQLDVQRPESMPKTEPGVWIGFFVVGERFI